jgi:hypothetical protein
MPAQRADGMDQDLYPWSPIVTRPVLRWPDNARVALALTSTSSIGIGNAAGHAAGERAGHVPLIALAHYRPAERGQTSRRGVALHPGHDGVWATTADDIAEYYLANYYDQAKSWIAERNAQTAS